MVTTTCSGGQTLNWSTITYLAALSALGAGILVAAAVRPRRFTVIATAAAGQRVLLAAMLAAVPALLVDVYLSRRRA